MKGSGNTGVSKVKRGRPALRPKAREDQMIALAMDRAEERLRDGTASNQLICHFLKQGSEKAMAEKKLLEQQCLLSEAKTKSIQSDSELKDMYMQAYNAMREYSGNASNESDPDVY